MNKKLQAIFNGLLASDAKLRSRIEAMPEVEQELLALLIQFEMITKQTWEFICKDEAMMDQYSRAMWSLTRSKWVVARPLHVGKMYFVLSQAMVGKLCLPARRAKPMVPPIKFKKYARLLYFTKYEPTACRLDKTQVETIMGEDTSGIPMSFVAIGGDTGCVGFMRIDQHAFGSAKHAAQAIRKDVHRLIQFDMVRQRLKQRKFEWIWITASHARADAVLTAFRQYEVGKASVRALVFDELVPLLIRKETRE